MEQNILISDPINVKVINFRGRQFILFGDIHFNREGLCSDQCMTYPAGDNMDPSCYTVAGIIDKIITTSPEQYIDVYFEAGFNKNALTTGDIQSISQASYAKEIIVKTTLAFRDCLYGKILCPYNNARFHYVDVRTDHVKNIFSGFLTQFIDKPMKYLNTTTKIELLSNIPVDIKIVERLVIDTIILIRVNIMMNLLINEIQLENCRIWEYYRMCIESNDFVNDYTRWVKDVLQQINGAYLIDCINILATRFPDEASIKYITNTIMEIPTKISNRFMSRINPLMITYRDGKVMHKIRTQLNGLELQGDAPLASSITQFIYYNMKRQRLEGYIQYINLFYTNWMSILMTNDAELIATYVTNLNEMNTMYNTGDVWSTIKGIVIEANLVDAYTLARMFSFEWDIYV